MERPKVDKTQSAFRVACRVEVNIKAKAERVWGLLTNAPEFSRWNSTVASIEGAIRDGEKIRLRVPDSNRVFALTVSRIVPNARMTWASGFGPMFKGVRTFDLKQRTDGSTDFVMEERFAGLMLPLIKRSLPDFGPVFDRYASDLKREAEKSAL